MCGDALLGRVLDGMGVPIDGKGDCAWVITMQQWGVYRHAPDPFYRKPIDAVLSTGVRSFIMPLQHWAQGQRVGLFAFDQVLVNQPCLDKSHKAHNPMLM